MCCVAYNEGRAILRGEDIARRGGGRGWEGTITGLTQLYPSPTHSPHENLQRQDISLYARLVVPYTIHCSMACGRVVKVKCGRIPPGVFLLRKEGGDYHGTSPPNLTPNPIFTSKPSTPLSSSRNSNPNSPNASYILTCLLPGRHRSFPFIHFYQSHLINSVPPISLL